jgi:AcrR family transcriptional regulator
MESATMNQMPIRPITAQPITRRALAKQRTRQKVLEAAKQLFTERGYEAATVRDIAAAAGMSTGAVFASFTDKADLFNEVIIADYDALAGRMAQAAAAKTSVEAALLELLSVGYAFQLEQLPLLQAGVAVSWSRSAGVERRNRQGLKPILGLVVGVLKRGVASGELAPDADVILAGETIWDIYLSSYRRAVFDQWGLEALRERLRAQIGLVLAGFRRAA